MDCFKKFHTKKGGKEWATDCARTLYEKMDAIKAKSIFEVTKTNDYQIFLEVVVANIAEKVLQKKKKIWRHILERKWIPNLQKLWRSLRRSLHKSCNRWAYHNNLNIDPATTDDTSRDEEDNSNNNIEVENNLEGDSEED
ncbi:hypothetical protein CMV_012821 [Castanea mollissima]|uniref:Uncharacterized protein n=1 Tax=Castanea mollissima TaxID=60419 RepID=A0A8J4VVM0_9ROSI|nr:hypothetical protein CMV_012821 [Castanea mollissima]